MTREERDILCLIKKRLLSYGEIVTSEKVIVSYQCTICRFVTITTPFKDIHVIQKMQDQIEYNRLRKAFDAFLGPEKYYTANYTYSHILCYPHKFCTSCKKKIYKYFIRKVLPGKDLMSFFIENCL